VSETYAAVAALAKSDQSLSLEELKELPHHDRVGLEAFRNFLRSRPLVAGVSDETHDVDGTRQTTVRGHKQNGISYS
jgi:Na+/H+ antiporter NhaB